METAPVAIPPPPPRSSLTLLFGSPSGLSPPRHRRPWWLAARGRELGSFSPLFSCRISFSNKVDLGFLFSLFAMSMVATLGGDQGSDRCCSFTLELLSKKMQISHVPMVAGFSLLESSWRSAMVNEATIVCSRGARRRS
jgi:hypothetical protein